jgi:hypothetical protein
MNPIKSTLNNLKDRIISGIKQAPANIGNYLKDRWQELPDKLSASNISIFPTLTNPQPTPTQIQEEPINITIPGKDGQPFSLPNRNNNPNNKLTAEDLYESLDPYGIATESAKVLLHPSQQTRTPNELSRLGESWNYGENPELSIGEMKEPNNDGSFDYGPMRNNDRTIADLLSQPYWKKALNKRGVNSLDDIKNSTKASIEAALMTLLRSNYGTYQNEIQEQGTDTPNLAGKLNYRDWYAADPELRNR